MRRPSVQQSPAGTPRGGGSTPRPRSSVARQYSSGGSGRADDAISSGQQQQSQAFTFDDEHLSLRAKTSDDTTIARDDSMTIPDLGVTASLSVSQRQQQQEQQTPRKIARDHHSAAQTPTRLQHALSSVGRITTPSRARSRTGYMTSPQSSFALSPSSGNNNNNNRSESSGERAMRCFCRRAVWRVVLPILWMTIIVGIWNGSTSRRRVGVDGASTTSMKIPSSSKAAKARPEGATRRDDTDEQQVVGVGGAHEIILNDGSESADKRKLEDGIAKPDSDIPSGGDADDVTSNVGLIPEHAAFQKMLERILEKRRKCERIEPRTNLRATSRQATTEQPSLAPFGIISSLERYQYPNATMTVGDTNQCYLPPKTSCHLKNYTVYINAHRPEAVSSADPRYAQKRYRSIFVLALRALSLTSCSEVIIDLDCAKESLEWEKSYGSRLLMWHSDPNHPVTILFKQEDVGGSDMYGTSKRYHNPRLSDLRNDAIFYVPPTGQDMEFSSGGIEAGFQLWRRYSDTLVFADTTKTGDKAAMVRKSWQPSTADCPGSGSNGIGNAFHAWSNVYSSPFFLHKKYSCFIFHDVFSDLQRMTYHASKGEEQNIEPTTVFMQSIVTHLSGTEPRIFPPLLHRKKDQTATSGQIMEAVDEVMKKAGARRRRLSTDAGKPLSPSPMSMSIAVSDYFGGDIGTPVDWCKTGPGTRCGYLSDASLITLNMLPWMNEGGEDFDTCPM